MNHLIAWGPIRSEAMRWRRTTGDSLAKARAITPSIYVVQKSCKLILSSIRSLQFMYVPSSSGPPVFGQACLDAFLGLLWRRNEIQSRSRHQSITTGYWNTNRYSECEVHECCTKHNIIRLKLIELLPTHCHTNDCDDNTCDWEYDGNYCIDWAKVFRR